MREPQAQLVAIPPDCRGRRFLHDGSPKQHAESNTAPIAQARNHRDQGRRDDGTHGMRWAWCLWFALFPALGPVFPSNAQEQLGGAGCCHFRRLANRWIDRWGLQFQHHLCVQIWGRGGARSLRALRSKILRNTLAAAGQTIACEVERQSDHTSNSSRAQNP